MFDSEKLDGKQILRYTLKESESIDRITLGMLANSSVKGFAKVNYLSEDGEGRFTFFIGDAVNIKDFLFESLNIGEIAQMSVSLADIFIDSCSNLIPSESICPDPDYIFIDPATKHLTVICVPVYPNINTQSSDIMMKSILRNVIPDSDASQKYIDALLKYADGSGSFSWKQFKQLALTYKPEDAEQPTLTDRLNHSDGTDFAADIRKSNHVYSRACTIVEENVNTPVPDSNKQNTRIYTIKKESTDVCEQTDAFMPEITFRELLKDFSKSNLKAYINCRKRKKTAGNFSDNEEPVNNDGGSSVDGEAYLTRKKTGGIVPVAGQLFRIGKDSSQSDYTVYGNPCISRNHASIINKNGLFYICDNHSTNRTYIDGSEVSPGREAPLKDGTVIRLANEDFIFNLSMPTYG